MADNEVLLSDFGVDKAARYNEGKPRLGLLPPELMVEVAKVMTFGASKYGDDNWKKGLSDENCLSSCMRHLAKYMAGNEFDAESGLPHLAHAACNIAFLLHFHYPVMEEQIKSEK